MKTRITIALITMLAGILVCMAWPSNPRGSVTLAWTRSTSTSVSGYKIYWGPSSRNYTNSMDVGDFAMGTVTNLARGSTYFFAATAYTTNLESDFSSEVSATLSPLPFAPQNLTITLQQ